MFWPFDFSTQAWDVDGASIYVADSSKVQVKKGREESFSVPLNSLEADVRSCKRGGNPDESCNNHITNVQVCPDMEAQLVACGTNALQPEVFFLDNATYSGKRHTHQLCPKSSEIDALVQVCKKSNKCLGNENIIAVANYFQRSRLAGAIQRKSRVWRCTSRRATPPK